MLAVFVATVFLSAALLFLVQPMFARMVLPLLGGSPAVWNTTMVFYQFVLLAGYGYVHVTTTRLSRVPQVLLHAVVLALPLVALPIGLPPGWSPPVQENPVLWLLAVLAISVGLPFFVVSTTGPLLQKWFASSRHRTATDPYFLYAASNLGSMIGLLSYPFLLEPSLRLGEQSALWATGYGALLVLAFACAFATWRSRRDAVALGIVAEPHPPAAAARPEVAPRSEPLPWRRRLRWVLLAFAPSSLMLGVTTHLSTEIAAIPLLWVIPLAIYLLTFTLAFARRPPLTEALVLRALPLVLLPLTVMLVPHLIYPAWFGLPAHLLVQFVATLACHGALAKDRPATAHLSEYYLWIAAGGVLGGAFNALVAPLVFGTVLEYPLMIVLIAAITTPIRPQARGMAARWNDLALPAALAAALFGLGMLLAARGTGLREVDTAFIAALAAVPLFAWSRRPQRFALGLAVLLLANPLHRFGRERTLHSERSFFGIHRVIAEPDRALRRLVHGTTVHGLQSTRPDRRREPLGYYHRSGPIGQAFAALAARQPDARVAVAGLGAGTLAGYAEPGQDWTFYEIDPAVARIARDPRYFTYLADCRASSRVILGDARLSLATSTEQFDLLVLDAYSSDAIPTHLITREALRLYLDRLAPGGMLAFHVSNRYFDLAPVVAALAADARLACLIRRDGITRADSLAGKTASDWMVAARRRRDLAPLDADPRWRWARMERPAAPWSDDLASPLTALRWVNPPR